MPKSWTDKLPPIQQQLHYRLANMPFSVGIRRPARELTLADINLWLEALELKLLRHQEADRERQAYLEQFYTLRNAIRDLVQ